MDNNKLIEKINRTPDSLDEEAEDLFKRYNNIKQQGYIAKEQGIDILKWKSPRPLRHYKNNTEDEFREITRLAFSVRDEKVKIHILTALRGVRYPAASALLMFYDKTIYPIIDIRTWKQLYKAGFVNENQQGQNFSLDQWKMYLDTVRDIASRLKLTARQVEKRLFDIDKEAQEGNLYKTYKKK